MVPPGGKPPARGRSIPSAVVLLTSRPMPDPVLPLPEPDEAPRRGHALPRLLVRRRLPDLPAQGFLAGLRIRKKLLFLHTVFSLTLAAILLLAVRPALREVVYRAELDESMVLLSMLGRAAKQNPSLSATDLAQLAEAAGKQVRFGTAEQFGLTTDAAARATVSAPLPIELEGDHVSSIAVMYLPGLREAEGSFMLAVGRIDEARRAVFRFYVLVSVALLAVYALVAVALERFILPQHVYAPIRRILAADRAVRDGNPDQEIINDRYIPADELGEIMRSRNEAVLALREHQRRLAEAIDKLNAAATDLKRKNHLLESARKNLADADRLASLGMMSAGIAHELNTPLTVLKGLVEQIAQNPGHGIDPATAALMVRVVGRLERLGDSLLDFARARPPRTSPVALRYVVEEAVTLVKLDRQCAGIQIDDLIDPSLIVECDPARMVQVFVNLVRNAVEAVRSGRHDRNRETGRISIHADQLLRDRTPWVTVTIRDNGPGINPEVLSRLFEPFVSTRLDSNGTGLGLAVSEGIIREHGGVIFARNRADSGGAEFEILLPVRGAAAETSVA